MPAGIVRSRLHRLSSLDAALRIAAATAPNLQHLACVVLPLMPRMPRASQNLRAITRDHASAPMPLHMAIGCVWMAWDSATHQNALFVDIDHSDAFDLWLDLPENIRPTLVIDPWSGRAHGMLPLTTPVCLTAAGREEPRELASFACRLLAAALGGTAMPPGSLAKSPWGTRRDLIGSLRRVEPTPMHPERHAEAEAAGLTWWTLPGAGRVELRTVVAALRPRYEFDAAPSTSFRWRARHRDPEDSRGRNCTLFNASRYWAYANEEQDGYAIHCEATRLNGKSAVSLPAAEVAGLARSVTRFMNGKWAPQFGTGGLRGRDALLTQGLSPRDAQSVAGTRTTEVRRDRTDEALRVGLAALEAGDQRVTQLTLATAAGVSLSTVKRRWHHLSEPHKTRPRDGAEVETSRCQPLHYQVMSPVVGPQIPAQLRLLTFAEAIELNRGRHRQASRYLVYARSRTRALSRRGFRVRCDTVIRRPVVWTAEVKAAWVLLRAARGWCTTASEGPGGAPPPDGGPARVAMDGPSP